jgi:membrane protein YdbS with pleckstrin-like domain
MTTREPSKRVFCIASATLLVISIVTIVVILYSTNLCKHIDVVYVSVICILCAAATLVRLRSWCWDDNQ